MTRDRSTWLALLVPAFTLLVAGCLDARDTTDIGRFIVGDGEADDTNGFIEAVEDALAHDRPLRIDRQVRIARDVVIDLPRDLVIEGTSVHQARFELAPNAELFFRAGDPWKGTLRAATPRLARRFPLASTEGLAPGMLVSFETGQLTEEAARAPGGSETLQRSHIGRIVAVEDDAVLLDRRSEWAFDVDEHPVSVTAAGSVGVTLRKLSFVGGVSGAHGRPHLVSLENLSGSRVERCGFRTREKVFQGAIGDEAPVTGWIVALRIYRSSGTRVRDCGFAHIGYGVWSLFSADTVAEGIEGWQCRHVGISSKGSYDYVMRDFVTVDCVGGIDSHGAAVNTVYENGRVVDDREGSTMRGRSDVWRNVSVHSRYPQARITIFSDSGIADAYTHEQARSGSLRRFEDCRLDLPLHFAGTLFNFEFIRNTGRFRFTGALTEPMANGSYVHESPDGVINLDFREQIAEAHRRGARFSGTRGDSITFADPRWLAFDARRGEARTFLWITSDLSAGRGGHVWAWSNNTGHPSIGQNLTLSTGRFRLSALDGDARGINWVVPWFDEGYRLPTAWALVIDGAESFLMRDGVVVARFDLSDAGSFADSRNRLSLGSGPLKRAGEAMNGALLGAFMVFSRALDEEECRARLLEPRRALNDGALACFLDLTVPSVAVHRDLSPNRDVARADGGRDVHASQSWVIPE